MPSELHERCNLLLVLRVVDVGKNLERLVDVAALQRADFAEFKPDAHSKGMTVLLHHLDSLLVINLVSHHDSSELPALVLLLDARIPVL